MMKNTHQSIKEFAIKRLCRLLPGIYFIFLICALFKLFNFVPWIIEFNLWSDIFSNIFLVSLLGDTMIYWLTWFVGSLFWVSLFYYSLFKIIPTQCTFIFITALITFTSFALFLKMGFSFNASFAFIKTGYIRGFASIGLGILLSFLIKNITFSKSISSKIFCTISEIILLVFLSYTITMIPSNQAINAVIMFSLLLLFFIKGTGLVSSLSNHFFPCVLGQSTYMIYLSHRIFFFILLTFFSNFISKLGIGFSIFMGLGLATLLGMILHVIIEAPIQKYLKKKF